MKSYYQEQLDHLRVLGARYAEEHPAVAPLLASEGADPDVERILEGTAFLCGLINQRLDENFPEIIQGLISITAPQLLLPLPSQSLVQFTPLAHVNGVQHAAQGTVLASLPVDNISCLYTLTHALDILPATVSKITLEQRLPDEATLHFSITSQCPVSQWLTDTLHLYLHDHLSRSAQWYMLLLQYTRSIVATSGAKTLTLPPHALQAYDINAEQTVYDGEALFSCFQTLRDYYTFPEKFLFLNLHGLSRLAVQVEANSLNVSVSLRGPFGMLPQPGTHLLALNVTPVSNIFTQSADPFILSHKRQDYRLTPQGESKRHAEIHSLRSVTGVTRGGETRTYVPYAGFVQAPPPSAEEKKPGTYVVRRTISPVNGRMDYHLGLLYEDPSDVQEHETLIAELACYQPVLPLQLHIGDICNPTDSSPAMATFSNIVKPTTPIPPLGDHDTLWQLFSHLQSNLLPLASATSLRRFLALYFPPHNMDPALLRLNQQRLEAIKQFEAIPDEMLWKGRPLRGQRLDLVIGSEGFTSQGEIFLFGTVLDTLLAQFATINTYTRLHITNSSTGDTMTWMPRLGNKRLL